MSVNFSHVCIMHVKIYVKMSSGGLEVSLSIYRERYNESTEPIEMKVKLYK